MYIVFSEIKIQMRIKLSNVLIYLVLLLSFGLRASHEEITTTLSFEERMVISGQDMLVFEDVEKTFEINNFQSPYAIPPYFKPYPKRTLNFGFANHDVWILFALENPSENELSGYLKFDNPILDSIDIYSWNLVSKRFELVQTIGDQVKNLDRSIRNRNLIAHVDVQSNETRFFLVRINNGGEQFHFSLTYQTNLSFQEEDHFHQFFFGIYFGILVFVLIFNIFLYFSIKEKLSLYYVCYLFSLGVLQLSLNGFGKEFIWPSSGYLANHINPIFASAGIYFLLLFVREFLQLGKLMSRIDTAFKWFGYLVVLNIVLSAIPDDSIYQLSVLIINGLTMVLTLAIIPVAFYALKKQFKPARYFIAAFLLLVVAVGAFVLKNFGVIESNNFSNYGLQYGSALEVILLSVAIIDRFKQFREQSIKRLNELNEFRKKVNEELEQKVKDRTAEVVEQKKQIEEQNVELEYKNQEVMSSITYARRIQEAILPSKEKLDELFTSYGILYLPRDVVAGDFYWAEPLSKDNNDVVLLAAADCTGHGVPGAMVSVLCHNALNSALDEISGCNTGELLDNVDAYIKSSFSNGTTQISDGMDISLICWDKIKRKIFWSGANNPLWILREGELIDYTPDKQPIGWGQNKSPFRCHEIAVLENDRIILFSDGFADQFGGPRGKKLKSKTFKEELILKSDLAPIELTNYLNDFFIKWKGKEGQVDDVCVVVLDVV